MGQDSKESLHNSRNHISNDAMDMLVAGIIGGKMPPSGIRPSVLRACTEKKKGNGKCKQKKANKGDDDDDSEEEEEEEEQQQQEEDGEDNKGKKRKTKRKATEEEANEEEEDAPPAPKTAKAPVAAKTAKPAQLAKAPLHNLSSVEREERKLEKDKSSRRMSSRQQERMAKSNGNKTKSTRVIIINK
jgi:hypothetical protein